jgi:hypothetical protein
MAETPVATPVVATPVATPVVETPVATPEAKIEAKVEAKVEATPKVNEPRRAEALARVKREAAAVRKQQEELKTEKATIEAQRQKLQRFDDLDKLLREDPLKFLEATGLKFEDIANRVIKGNVKTPEQIANAEVRRLFAEKEKAETEAKNKAVEAQHWKEMQGVMDASKAELATLLKAGGDKYELLNSMGEQTLDLVWSRIEEHFDATLDEKTGLGQVLAFDKLLDTVEAELEQQLEKQLLGTKKISAILAKRAAAEKEAAEAAAKTKQKAKVPATKTGSTVSASPEVTSPEPKLLRTGSYARAQAATNDMVAEYRRLLAEAKATSK